MGTVRGAIAAAAALAVGAVAVPAGAAPENNPNWHVHDVVDGVKQSSVALRPAGVAFFPTLFVQEGDVYDPINDPVVCPDATDKAGTLHNGQHTNRRAVNGVCHTDEYIIHLRSDAGGSGTAPQDWGSVPFGSLTVFYQLTPRGH